MQLTPRQVKDFQKNVWNYYTQNKRPMEWRDNLSPYSIVVSEIMLQQTQVNRVTEKYAEFMAAFPSFKELARADNNTILSVWQGLGYNRRGLYLKQLAEIVQTDFKGILPADIGQLEKMPGIGPATARSIVAFAFNTPVSFIETNVRSVFIHHFFTNGNVDDSSILPLVQQTLPAGKAREWYWALMDYGTHLKQLHGNPNKRSLQYTKQSKFEGSNRQKRGMVLRALLTKSLSLSELAKSLSLQERVLSKVLAQLAKEGFVKKQGNRFSII
jgi:A/G-specific adenine glycosylase